MDQYERQIKGVKIEIEELHTEMKELKRRIRCKQYDISVLRRKQINALEAKYFPPKSL